MSVNSHIYIPGLISGNAAIAHDHETISAILAAYTRTHRFDLRLCRVKSSVIVVAGIRLHQRIIRRICLKFPPFFDSHVNCAGFGRDMLSKDGLYGGSLYYRIQRY